MATETASVLFTDVVASTRLRGRLGEERADELRRTQHETQLAAVERAGGRVVKGLGDGIMAVFPSAADAVAAAVDIQRAAARPSHDNDGDPPAVRVGVSVGDVRFEDGDCFGTTVVEASRLCEAADGGQILVADLVKALTRGRGGFRFESVGELDLKGLEDPVSVSAVQFDQEAERAPVKILIVDDHPLWRETIRSLLEQHRDFDVVGDVGDPDGALGAVAVNGPGPDLVIMDVDLPGVSGIETTARLLEERPDVKVLMLSANDDRKQVLAAVRAGASGYLVKTSAASEIADAIGRISRGDMVFPPSLAQHVLAALRGATMREEGPVASLTDSERDVLALMADGQSNAAIAGQLHLSQKTIESRIGSIFTKLGLDRDRDHNRRVRAVLTYLEAVETE